MKSIQSSLIVLSILYAVIGSDAVTLNELCSDKKGVLKIRSIDEVNSLFNRILNSDVSQCSSYQIEAFQALDEVLNPGKPVEACSMERVTSIEKFHMKYIDSKSADTKHLVPAGRKFFIEFAMRLHQHCIKNMVNKLKSDEKVLTNSDEFVIKEHMEKSSILQFALKRVENYDDLALLTDTIDPEAKILKEDRTIVGAVTIGILRMHRSCKETFRPIYERRVLPVTKLARLGYNYLSKEEQKRLGPAKNNEEIQKWYKLTMMCDAILFYEFKHDRRFRGMHVATDSDDYKPSEDVQPERKLSYARVPADGETKITDSLFFGEPTGKELDRAVSKFNPKRDYLEETRKAFLNRLSSKAKKIVIRQFLKNKIFNKDGTDKSINVSRMMKELDSKRDDEKYPISIGTQLKELAWAAFILATPLGWIALLHTLITAPRSESSRSEPRQVSHSKTDIIIK